MPLSFGRTTFLPRILGLSSWHWHHDSIFASFHVDGWSNSWLYPLMLSIDFPMKAQFTLTLIFIYLSFCFFSHGALLVPVSNPTQAQSNHCSIRYFTNIHPPWLIYSKREPAHVSHTILNFSYTLESSLRQKCALQAWTVVLGRCRLPPTARLPVGSSRIIISRYLQLT